MDDPEFYREHMAKRLELQRKYARDPEYCRKRRLANADYKFRKARGLPTRAREPLGIPMTPPPPAPFQFALVKEITVDFS